MPSCARSCLCSSNLEWSQPSSSCCQFPREHVCLRVLQCRVYGCAHGPPSTCAADVGFDTRASARTAGCYCCPAGAAGGGRANHATIQVRRFNDCMARARLPFPSAIARRQKKNVRLCALHNGGHCPGTCTTTLQGMRTVCELRTGHSHPAAPDAQTAVVVRKRPRESATAVRTARETATHLIATTILAHGANGRRF